LKFPFLYFSSDLLGFYGFYFFSFLIKTAILHFLINERLRHIPVFRKICNTGEKLNEFLLVQDSEITSAIRHYVHATRSLVEHAGAASLAAALKIKDSLKGKRVVLVASGGNITTDQLKAVLA